MRALLELAAALKGTIEVALRRAGPMTLAIGGAVAVLALGGSVLALGALGGSGDGGPDELAGGRSGPHSDADVDGGGAGESDAELVDPDGRPLIDGVASRPAPVDDTGGTTAGDTGGGADPTDGAEVVLDGSTTAGEPEAPVNVPDAETSPEPTSTSTVDPDSSTTTEGTTTTTTTTAEAGSSSGGGLLGGLLHLLGIG